MLIFEIESGLKDRRMGVSILMTSICANLECFKKMKNCPFLPIFNLFLVFSNNSTILLQMSANNDQSR